MAHPVHEHSEFHKLTMQVVEIAKGMFAMDRVRDPDRDPFDLVQELAEGLSADIGVSIALQLRGLLYSEGLIPKSAVQAVDESDQV